MKHRETSLLEEPLTPKRLNCIIKVLDKLKLPESTRILDFGGNNFKKYCAKKKYKYTTINLRKPQKNGKGGYNTAEITYNGRDIPLKKNSFDVIIVSFVLHHTSSNCIHILKQLKEITTAYLIISEDLCGIRYPIKWHQRCFDHQKDGIFRSDEEWKYLFQSLDLKLVDILNIRSKRDHKFSNPYSHIYRIQYTLRVK